MSTLRCSACGHENRAGQRFCAECGTRLAVACPTCAAPTEPADRFCGACGAELRGAPIAEPAYRSPEPRTYTPRHLAEKILSSRAALEGERKQVTVLFADVKGSLELAESLDPEEWHRILERFLEILSEGVHRFEGTVNQYTGDGTWRNRARGTRLPRSSSPRAYLLGTYPSNSGTPTWR